VDLAVLDVLEATRAGAVGGAIMGPAAIILLPLIIVVIGSSLPCFGLPWHWDSSFRIERVGSRGRRIRIGILDAIVGGRVGKETQRFSLRFCVFSRDKMLRSVIEDAFYGLAIVGMLLHTCNVLFYRSMIDYGPA
jgi:hypothetical protein